MSSTISIEVGTKYYIPFWVLLEYLDAAPPNPFIEVEVISLDTKYGSNPDGPVEVPCCDLRCDGKRQLIAHGIPTEYLIEQTDLKEWANKIADWFRSFDGI